MLALKVVFGKLLPVPKLCKNVSTMCIYAVGKSVFRPKKKLLFVTQNLRIWGIMGAGGQNMWSKVPYLESPTLICLSLCNFYGATMMIKGSLLLSAPIVKHFR